MWQAGWHFTQWQHIARSLLSLSRLSPCLCHCRFFSFLCSVFFLICFLFILFTFCIGPVSFSFLPLSAPILPWLFNLLFFLPASAFPLSTSLSCSLALSPSLLHPPLFPASNARVEKLVSGLKQQLPGNLLNKRVWYCAAVVSMRQNMQFDRWSKILNHSCCCTYRVQEKQWRRLCLASVSLT